MEMTKRALSGEIALEGLSKAVIHCEGQFWTIIITIVLQTEGTAQHSYFVGFSVFGKVDFSRDIKESSQARGTTAKCYVSDTHTKNWLSTRFHSSHRCMLMK